jgi:Reverse transcriptase (RNA-dependent DNA polymerase)
MLLGRIEDILENAQPEEQCGFRSGRRLEEHVLTVNMFIDKTFAANRVAWLISLDLSKAFDKVHWGSLFTALIDQGVPRQLVLALQCLYDGQVGQVARHSSRSRLFDVTAAVQHGCVHSPRLFAAVLESALGSWHRQVAHLGFDLQDGGPNLLELRFADDILLFAATANEASFLLDSLVRALAVVGLILNADKTYALTNETLAPLTISTPDGLTVNVLSGDSAHKWLGCYICMEPSGLQQADVSHHLQSATRAFYSCRHILCNHACSIRLRLRYFHATITQIACFGAGARTPRRADMEAMDVVWRQLLRQVVGPPPSMDWTLPWNVILH